MKTKPYDFQRKGVRKIHHFNGRALLADDMGLGKSFESMMYAEEADAFPALVICKASLKWNWQNEIRKHTGLRSHVLEHQGPKRPFNLRHPYVIINYQILKGWLATLDKLRFSLIIVDECHAISNRHTKQSKYVKFLCRRRRTKIIMISGTPELNHPAELYAPISILRPDVWGSFHAFGERYCAPEYKPWGWQYKGAENMDELHRKLLRYCMIRRLKKDVLKDLPTKTRTVIPLDIANRKEYEFAEKDFIGWLTKKSLRLALKARSAQRLVRLGYLRRLAATLKLPPVVQWIEDFIEETDEKLILFSPLNKAILIPAYERYQDQSVLVTGKVKGKKRQRLFDQFNGNNGTRFLFGNTEAAGEGWSCKSSSKVCHLALPWNPAKVNQADARVEGIERGIPGVAMHSYILVAKDTIEEDLCALLQRKQEHFNAALDGEGRGEDFDVFDQLTKMILRRK